MGRDGRIRGEGIVVRQNRGDNRLETGHDGAMRRLFLAMILMGAESAALWAADRRPPEILDTPEQLSKATDDYYNSLDAVSAKYRKALAGVMGTADKIEIYQIHLVVFSNENGKETRHQDPSEEEFGAYALATIRKRKLLSAEEMKRLLPILQATVAEPKPGRGAMCHDPGYGVRMWHGKEIIFESSLCFKCGNLSVPLPDRKDLIGMSQEGLLEAMQAILPIKDEGTETDGAKEKAKKKG